MPETVVFILSANYSGSTWLALLLGSHSQAFYVGELNKMFHDEPVPCRLCEEKGRACPVFHEVATIKPKNIHSHVLTRTGRKLLVDNSKTVSWSKKFLGETRWQRKYIHLLRDPRAIAYSLQLRQRPTNFTDWIDKNYEIRDFARQHDLNCRTITYNALAEHTDETLSQLCQWLDVNFETTQTEYWNFEHHGPGRNGATAAFLERYVASEAQFYSETKRTNFHDLRWQEKLEPQTREAILHDASMQTFLQDFQLRFSESGLALTNDNK